FELDVRERARKRPPARSLASFCCQRRGFARHKAEFIAQPGEIRLCASRERYTRFITTNDVAHGATEFETERLTCTNPLRVSRVNRGHNERNPSPPVNLLQLPAASCEEQDRLLVIANDERALVHTSQVLASMANLDQWRCREHRNELHEVAAAECA